MAMLWGSWKRGAQKHTSQVTAIGSGKGPAFLVNPAELRPLVRGLVSDDVIPLSWIQCTFSLFAYVWLLTNFVRTSFAIHHMDGYNTVEPNVFVNFGPYAYTGNTFNSNGVGLKNVTTAKPVALWGYKYDTTSLGMRAFAEYYNVSAFPDCVLYRGKCDSDFLAPATGLGMLDSLVDTVRNVSVQPVTSHLATQDSKYHHQLRPQTLLLRASYEYFDRIHHYLIPQVFANPFWRTCHVMYYSSELLSLVSASSALGFVGQPQSQTNSSTSLVDFCSQAYGGLRPYFCDDLWTNFGRSCSPEKPKCLSVGRVSLHVAKRLGTLRALYPNATVDLLLVEGIKDMVIHRGGLTFVAKRGADVLTLLRIRKCNNVNPDVCETLMLDEYRYEGETFTTDILWWYPIVATLRGAAQTYYWLRLLMLFGGCYYAAAAQMSNSEASGSKFKTMRRAFAIFFKIPSQVVIYGSVFPLTCYFFAHVIDSPIVYELMGQNFDSFDGLFQLSVTKLITISSIQMRNVWVLATIVRTLVSISTQRGWSPMRGIWGMPQFSIACISSLTIFSQFRFISLRWTPITTIQAVHVTSRLHPAIDALFRVNGGGGKSALGGIFLDLKAMTCTAVLLAILAAIITLAIKAVYRKSTITLIFWRSHSVTPLSAGVLWPTTCLAVCWSDDLFHFSYVSTAVLKRVSSFRTNVNKIQPLTTYLTSGSLMISQHTSRLMEVKSLDNRSQIVESVMYLMNITMLSDPLTFLLWRWNLSKTLIGCYRSAKTQQVYLVPRVHTGRRSDLNWDNFVLERTALADELTWREIITCG